MAYITPKGRLGASQPSRTRIAAMQQDVAAAKADNEKMFGNAPQILTDEERHERRAGKRMAENRFNAALMGFTGAVAVGALTVTLSLLHGRPGENHERQTIEHNVAAMQAKNRMNEIAREHAAQAPKPDEITQADINQAEKAQAELNRPPETGGQ